MKKILIMIIGYFIIKMLKKIIIYKEPKELIELEKKSEVLEELYRRYPGAIIKEHASKEEADLYVKYPGATITRY